MNSTLGRLFRYAKAVKHEAKENFLTEALAAVVHQDPGPMNALLQQVYARDPVFLAKIGASGWHTQTQVYVPEAPGFVDLLLSGDSWELWIEVKVNSKESGATQLTKYLKFVQNRRYVDARLLLLSPTDLRDGRLLHWATWQELWSLITPASTTHAGWHDLKRFLKELKMAHDHHLPIRTIEAASLGPSHAMFLKARWLLGEVAKQANQRTPGWPADEKEVQRQLTQQFWDFGQLAIYKSNAGAGVKAGVCHEDGDAWASLWIFCSPKNAALAQRIKEKGNALPKGWEPGPSGWTLFEVSKRLIHFNESSDAIAFYKDRLDELERTGILALLP